MKEMLIKEITEMLNACEDMALIDLVWRLLAKSKK